MYIDHLNLDIQFIKKLIRNKKSDLHFPQMFNQSKRVYDDERLKYAYTLMHFIDRDFAEKIAYLHDHKGYLAVGVIGIYDDYGIDIVRSVWQICNELRENACIWNIHLETYPK